MSGSGSLEDQQFNTTVGLVTQSHGGNKTCGFEDGWFWTGYIGQVDSVDAGGGGGGWWSTRWYNLKGCWRYRVVVQTIFNFRELVL